jgi:hypothetical protein
MLQSMRPWAVMTTRGRRTAYGTVVLALGIAVLSATASAGGPPALLLTGEFHGDEIQTAGGSGWLALVGSGSRMSLDPVVVTVTPVRDHLADGDSGPISGKRVSVSVSDTHPVLLVRGIPALQEGPVTEAQFDCAGCGQPTEFNLHRSFRLRLDGEVYELEAFPPQPDEPFDENSEIRLSHGAAVQVIHRATRVPDDANWRVIWAGDLDRDGRLDLFVDTADHYNMGRGRLLLSSAAGPGELVGEVAVFETIGC